MGINRLDLELVLRLRREGHLQDKAAVIELGAQQLARVAIEAKDVLSALGESFGAQGELSLSVPSSKREYADGREERLDPEAPMARAMWKWLGFSYAAIDIDGSPESIPLDLNFDDVPQPHRGQYNLVTNYGTTEHVANQMNAFKIAHDLTGPDGVMIHHLPCQGNLNHGLINYSPKFFWMLARSNDYKWLYFNYFAANESYPVPANLIEAVTEFEPGFEQDMAGKTLQNSALIVAFKKTRPQDYVPPIDVENGTVTTDKNLLARYPTVLGPADARE